MPARFVAYGQHGARRLTDHGLGGAAQQKAAQTAGATCAHDDQLSFRILGGGHDFVGGHAVELGAVTVD